MATTQSTLIMMPDDITNSLSIKPRLINELVYLSQETGFSISALVNDFLDWGLKVKSDAVLTCAQKLCAQKRRRDRKG